MVALANETGKDMYINVPSNVDPAYINNLADLIAYGSNGVTPYTSVQQDPTLEAAQSQSQGLHRILQRALEFWASRNPRPARMAGPISSASARFTTT